MAFFLNHEQSGRIISLVLMPFADKAVIAAITDFCAYA